MHVEDYVREHLGEAAATRLVHKLTGGKSNDDGFRFELFNCLVEVVDYAYAWAVQEPVEPDIDFHHPSKVLLTQGAVAFVDDVVVKTPEVSRYLQVKFGVEQKWTRGIGRRVASPIVSNLSCMTMSARDYFVKACRSTSRIPFWFGLGHMTTRGTLFFRKSISSP